jgi:hypothetical protein
MLSEDTQRRIKAIKGRVEEVGEALGIPRGEAAALVVVDVIEQHARKDDARQSGYIRIWAWFKGVLAHSAEEAKKIRIE